MFLIVKYLIPTVVTFEPVGSFENFLNTDTMLSYKNYLNFFVWMNFKQVTKVILIKKVSIFVYQFQKFSKFYVDYNIKKCLN